MDKKVMVILFLVLFMIPFGLGFEIQLDGRSLPPSHVWELVNNTNCDVYVSDDAIMFNSTGNPLCYYELLYDINESQDVEISFRAKNIIKTGSCGGLSYSGVESPDFAETPTGCGVAWRRQENSPSDLWRAYKLNPAMSILDYINLDGAWHDFEINFEARETGGHDIQVSVDGDTTNQTYMMCENNTNMSIRFGMDAVSQVGDNIVVFDDIEVTATATSESSAGCSFDTCDPPCIFYDTYSYLCSLDVMGYDLSPYKLIYPQDDQFCYDNTGSATELIEVYKGVFPEDDRPVMSEEFEFSVDGNGSAWSPYLEHRLIYLDEDTSSYLEMYRLQIYYNGTHNIITGLDTIEGTDTVICVDCFDLDTYHTLKITHVLEGGDAGSFWNESSNTIDPIHENTYQVWIDDENIGSNIDLTNTPNANHTVHADSFYFAWITSDVCINDYQLFYDSIEISDLDIIKDLKDEGDFCDEGSECKTGYCEYKRCATKGGGESCTAGWQCRSGECVNGYCNKPSMWENIEASRKNQIGDDANTGNFISLLIIVIVGVAVIIGGRSLIAVVGAMVLCFALTVFFVMVGWLNPLFLVGMIVMALLGTIIAFFVGGGSH